MWERIFSMPTRTSLNPCLERVRIDHSMIPPYWSGIERSIECLQAQNQESIQRAWLCMSIWATKYLVPFVMWSIPSASLQMRFLNACYSMGSTLQHQPLIEHGLWYSIARQIASFSRIIIVSLWILNWRSITYIMLFQQTFRQLPNFVGSWVTIY